MPLPDASTAADSAVPGLGPTLVLMTTAIAEFVAKPRAIALVNIRNFVFNVMSLIKMGKSEKLDTNSSLLFGICEHISSDWQ